MHLFNGKPQQFPHSNSSDIYMHYRLSFTFVCKCNSAGTVLEWPLNSIQKNKFFNLTRMHMTNKRLVVRSQHGLLKLIFINTPSAGQYHSQEDWECLPPSLAPPPPFLFSCLPVSVFCWVFRRQLHIFCTFFILRVIS